VSIALLVLACLAFASLTGEGLRVNAPHVIVIVTCVAGVVLLRVL
jgi:hypothetical protein